MPGIKIVTLARLQHNLHHQQDEHRNSKPGEEVIVLLVGIGRQLRALQVIKFIHQLILRRVAVVDMNITAAGCTGYLPAHILVQPGDDNIAVHVAHIVITHLYR